jgi:hypothetical protein
VTSASSSGDVFGFVTIVGISFSVLRLVKATVGRRLLLAVVVIILAVDMLMDGGFVDLVVDV